MALDPLTAALDVGGKLIDRLWKDPADAERARLELLKLAQAGDLAQIGVNTAEASSASVFTSGWRPGIGWVCGAALAWNFLGLPIGTFVSNLLGYSVALAPADMGEMMPVLLGMLGLGSLRTFERVKGVIPSGR